MCVFVLKVVTFIARDQKKKKDLLPGVYAQLFQDSLGQHSFGNCLNTFIDTFIYNDPRDSNPNSTFVSSKT